MDTAGPGATRPADPPHTDPASDVEDAGRGTEPRWVRPLVIVVAVVSLLLFGAAGGLLFGGLPGSGQHEPGPVDIGFSQDMSEHHLQAVEMASWERDHTTDPVLGQLAADIEATQTSQVGTMQGWLVLWDESVLPLGGHMAWMTEPSGMPGMSGHGHVTLDAATGAVLDMPGMASTAELQALRAATGPELDVLFLQLMLRHHQGGAVMLSYGAEHADVPQVRNLAAQMLKSQTAETEYLRQLLAQRGGTPLPI